MYQDITKIDWTNENEVRNAIKYHRGQLEIPYLLDDIERSWTLRTIDRLESTLEKLTNTHPEWLSLFQ